jgi:hypothetical protein
LFFQKQNESWSSPRSLSSSCAHELAPPDITVCVCVCKLIFFLHCTSTRVPGNKGNKCRNTV